MFPKDFLHIGKVFLSCISNISCYVAKYMEIGDVIVIFQIRGVSMEIVRNLTRRYEIVPNFLQKFINLLGKFIIFQCRFNTKKFLFVT